MIHDLDVGLAPAFNAPPGACDAHFHVFGPAEHYPYGAELRYQPPYAPLDAYMALARHLGFSRYVFVQPSAYGQDNECMLDAMRQVGTARCRGIVDVDETKVARETLREWHRLGVRGIRVNISPVRAAEPGLAAAIRPRIRRLGTLAESLGWHLDFLTPGWLVNELLEDLHALPVDFTVAHMGLFPASEGPDQPGFRAFLDLIRSTPRRCWVKLTGVYRLSTAPGFADAAPLARGVIEAAPDRIIWGSDYPHLSFQDTVGSIQLFNLLADWAPSQAVRAQILSINPTALFQFN